jgi:CRP/FNR family transcriptional regulator, cyclic AMP receptor protein
MSGWALLDGLPPDVVREFLAGARRRRFASGEVIVHEGDPADTLHLIEQGRVAVRVSTPLGDVSTLAIRGPGDVVGELALVDAPPGHRTATLLAIEPVETLAVRQAEFERLIADNPRVLEVLVRIMADRIRQLNALVLESRYVAAETRVRRRILELHEPGEDGSPRPIATTQEELAALAGTTRGTVNRVVREEVRRGTLETGRGRVTVIDAPALARRAR